VRREVWRRDEGRCTFVGREGRCGEMSFLEFHHVEPYATGGAATVANIQLRCRAHNAYEARLFFGDGVVKESRAMWGVHSFRNEFDTTWIFQTPVMHLRIRKRSEAFTAPS
jgi:hypothetical protein